jgi:hypothetical protein
MAGNIFYGSEGVLSVGSAGFQLHVRGKLHLSEAGKPDTAPHVANFLECVRSRTAVKLHAPLGEGHLSAALCHLANISYRLGREVRFDSAQENFGPDYEANLLLSRDYRAPYVVPEVV